MSYHVSIIRTVNGQNNPISRTEIIDLLATHKELSVSQTSSEILEITVSKIQGNEFKLIWQDEEIWTKNPNQTLLQLMINLAKELNARVRGDELETYITPEESYNHPDDMQSAFNSKLKKQQIFRHNRRNQWLLNGAIISIFVLLVILVELTS